MPIIYVPRVFGGVVILNTGPSINVTWVTRDLYVIWKTRDITVTWVTRDEEVTWKARN